MRSAQPLPRLPKLLLLGTVEVGLLPLRLAAKLLGGLLLVMAAVGVPAWLIQLLISLAGDGSGGGPLPAWAMILLLATAIPGGILLLHVASIPAPLRRANPSAGTDTGDAQEANDEEWAEPDANDEPMDPDLTEATGADPPAWAYATLELDPTASLTDIKAAYRRLAQLYHPDHNPGFAKEAAQRFAGINAAYEVLHDAFATTADDFAHHA